MISIRGVYDGKKIKPLEKFDVPPNVEVIITFIENKPGDRSVDDQTNDLLELSGTWEDDRSPDEIIKDIYESRTASKKDIHL